MAEKINRNTCLYQKQEYDLPTLEGRVFYLLYSTLRVVDQRINEAVRADTGSVGRHQMALIKNTSWRQYGRSIAAMFRAYLIAAPSCGKRPNKPIP